MSLEPAVIPLCPHCGDPLPGVSIFMWQVEGWIVISPYCPSCRVVLHTQCVPIPPAGIAPDPTARVIQPS